MQSARRHLPHSSTLMMVFTQGPHAVMRLKEKLQGIKGSGFMRDVRCVLAHPTLMNCFIESYGLNFVPEDLKRDTVLQQVTADVGSQGGAARASHTVR